MTQDEDFYAALLEDDPERLYDRAPCGYLSTTVDGTIIKVNGTFLALTGYKRSDLVGRKTFAELLSAGGRLYHETHFAPMLRIQGRAREIALEIVCADKRRLPVLVNSVLETAQSGAPGVIRTAVFDATDRREYERELLRARRRAEESEARASALARTLQATLIPPTPPTVPGLDVAAVYRPAGAGDEVGGDFYDVVQVGAEEWIIFLGDVCGKGVDAAAVTSLARYTLRAVAVDEPSPAAVLRRLNDALMHDAEPRMCTVMFARLARTGRGWSMRLSSGGHALPLLKREGVRPVGEPGTVLGVLATPTLHDVELRLQPGDVLVCYTDGVSEGRRDGEFYGDERVAERIAEHTGDAEQLAQDLLAEVLGFQNGRPRDDIAILVLRAPG